MVSRVKAYIVYAYLNYSKKSSQFHVYNKLLLVITHPSLLSLSPLICRLATGSFDQKTKIWTAEGKPMLQIACPGSVTGLSYIFQNKVLWIAAGTPMPMFFDPKLGANVRA